MIYRDVAWVENEGESGEKSEIGRMGRGVRVARIKRERGSRFIDGEHACRSSAGGDVNGGIRIFIFIFIIIISRTQKRSLGFIPTLSNPITWSPLSTAKSTPTKSILKMIWPPHFTTLIVHQFYVTFSESKYFQNSLCNVYFVPKNKNK